MSVEYHPELIKYVKLVKSRETTPSSEFNQPNSEKSVNNFRSLLNANYDSSSVDFTGTKFELFLPPLEASQSHLIPVYIYRPSDHDTNPTVFIYFHGGGMIAGARKHTDVTCKQLCNLSKSIIVNVKYRLYPENPPFAPYDDGVGVARWILKNKELIGAGFKSKVGIGGCSAGGKIAASVAHDVPGLSFQVLVYPQVSGQYSLPSYQTMSTAPGLTLDFVKWAFQFDIEKVHPRCASLLRTEFAHLPPVLFIVAEVDPFRDESYEYAKKLNENNVYHEFLLFKGVCHGFYNKPGIFKENCKTAYDATVAFMHRFGSA